MAALCPSVLLDAAPLLGAVPPDSATLRAREGSDAAGGAWRARDPQADPPLHGADDRRLGSPIGNRVCRMVLSVVGARAGRRLRLAGTAAACPAAPGRRGAALQVLDLLPVAALGRTRARSTRLH